MTEHIPTRRREKKPLGEKVFSYYTKDERKLLEEAAEIERRSLSAFVAAAAIEKARKVLTSKTR